MDELQAYLVELHQASSDEGTIINWFREKKPGMPLRPKRKARS